MIIVKLVALMVISDSQQLLQSKCSQMFGDFEIMIRKQHHICSALWSKKQQKNVNQPTKNQRNLENQKDFGQTIRELQNSRETQLLIVRRQ